MIKSQFSDAQREAICHNKGPCMVIAGPGSGKTTVITNRIRHLIESKGVAPSDILVISFTRAAASEMEKRFNQLSANRMQGVRFGTFHSIFFWIIKTAYKLDNSCVITEDEKKALVEKIFSEKSLNYENRDEMIIKALAQISLVKCDMLDIENYYSQDMPEEEFREIYKCLNLEMKRRRKIDFDDMLVMCYQLLNEREDILNQCRNIFKYIMVDEFQDSNRIQYEIFKLLVTPRNNAFVVGDDDQSVYGFRGAKPDIMQQFKVDFPDSRLVYLGENYRCDKMITRASIGVIEKNSRRFGKKLVAHSTGDGVVNFISPRDVDEENSLLIKHIRTNYEQGIPYEEQAVIYRTNIQPRRLVYKLNQFNIPYTISDTMPNIFEHFVIRNVLDYMTLAMGDMSRAVLLRVLNKPSRYISRNMLIEDPVDYDKLRWRLRDKDYAVDNLDKLVYDLRLLKKMRPFAALSFIRKGIGYDDYIKEYSQYRQLDEGEFYDILDEFANMIADMTSYGEMFEFIAEYSELLKKQQEHNKIKKGVNLVTMHSSKGLEYDTVYIIDAVEEITPYKKAKSPAEMEEERRMFYVAMTRARHELNIFSPKLISGKAKNESRFVKDAKTALNK